MTKEFEPELDPELFEEDFEEDDYDDHALDEEELDNWQDADDEDWEDS